MASFEHYMYVLMCGDGSLYTGYATDVDARLSAHRAGRGAKYTKSHAPVSLVAQARFYSKERAMSAEAHFKRLSRERKDELLTMAEHEPLEDVLCRELPGFGEDTAGEFVCRELAGHVDEGYGDFMARCIPTLDRRRIAGVRTPDLRRIARMLGRREDAGSFMRTLPHRLFEENQVHAFTLGAVPDYDAAVRLYDAFLPHVDNWATCDQLPVRVLAQRPGETLTHVDRWLASGACCTMRFAIGVLMRLFLDERFEPRFLEKVAAARLRRRERLPRDDRSPRIDSGAGGRLEPAPGSGPQSQPEPQLGPEPQPGSEPQPEPQPQSQPGPQSEAYYVDMMRAWYFAEALAKQEGSALPYFERGGGAAPLDEWTRRKAIQKALESRKIAPELKDLLRDWR